MPELKVVEFRDSPDVVHNNAEVVRLLKEAIGYAESETSQSLALVMLNKDGSVVDCWHSGGRPYVMVGAMESLRIDFINANIERR